MIKMVGAMMAGGAALLVAGAAHATVINSGLAYGANSATETLTDTTDTGLTSLFFAIDQFDPTGHGTLTSVTLSFTDQATITSGYISNLSASPITAGSVVVSEGAVLAPGLSGVTGLPTTVAPSDTYVATMGANGNASTVAPGANQPLDYYVNQTTSAGGILPQTTPITISVANPALTLSQWTGTGTNSLDLTLSPSFTASGVSGSSSFGAGGSVSNIESLTVTYAFSSPVSDVPEPATLALLCSGLLALGFVRYRGAR